MGMTAQYVMVTASELQELLSGNQSFDDIWRTRSDESCCWFFGSNAEQEQLKAAKKNGQHLWVDLDKRYREMHWLLTGENFPAPWLGHLPKSDNLLSLAMYAEHTVPGTEDRGYDQYYGVRYLTPARVKEIAEAFAQSTVFELAEKNDLDIENAESMDVEFNRFQQFYLYAAKADDAVLQYFI
jgi:hypothetical protein